MGVGLSCDGVKIEANGRKYYDFVTNYSQVSRHSVVQGCGIFRKIYTPLSLVIHHVGAESAD